jgi:hypothetical protein
MSSTDIVLPHNPPAILPDSTGLSVGSTATSFTPGFFDFRYSPAPVMVPPVPTPATKKSTCREMVRTAGGDGEGKLWGLYQGLQVLRVVELLCIHPHADACLAGAGSEGCWTLSTGNPAELAAERTCSCCAANIPCAVCTTVVISLT